MSASFIAVESFFARLRGALGLALPFTFLSTHARIGFSTSRLFFSTIIMWPLPWMPWFTSRSSSALHARLFEVGDRARIARRRERRFRRDDHDRDVLQVLQLARRLFLNLDRR